jgi:hypothetical protein
MVDNETMDRDFPTRVEKKNPYSDTNHDFNYSRESRKYTNDNIDSKSVDDVRKEYNIAPPVKKHTEEVKDYRKMVSTKKEDTKKPFKVTPVISPVYGILDKNYTADDVLEKRELINKTNSGVKPRMFGPVSYNDQPLPTLKKSNTTLKEDLVELNETVNELITEPVVSESIENVEEDIVIQTENYDDYETSSIENEYIGNNNIEDAFDTTDEYKAINEHDNEESIQDDNLDDTVPSIDVEALIDKNDDDDDDDENLDNTIETDLFNLIDSMYKSDDKESDGE